MRSGIWQLAVGGGGPVERRNKLSECCRADEKSLSGRNAPMGSRHRSLALSLFLSVFPSLSLSLSTPSLLSLFLLSLYLSTSRNTPFIYSPCALILSFSLSLISFRRCFVGRGGENNQRKFDGNTRITSDHEMRSDTFRISSLCATKTTRRRIT